MAEVCSCIGGCLGVSTGRSADVICQLTVPKDKGKVEKSTARISIDNAKLKMVCGKIADGIAELQNLGLSKEQILQGLERQTHEFFKHESK